MRKTVLLLRKLIVALIGFPVVIIGIILIPLPGPGILISLLGLLILSFEFEWARTHADRLKAVVRTLLDRARGGR
jgi:uncharacterized protein (TIGR02611 family)